MAVVHGMDAELIGKLENKARRIRELVVTMIGRSGSGHPGPALSIADVMSTLYFHVLRVDPKDPRWSGRDRVVLSKGHGCAAWYAALAERGFFPEEWLWTFRQLGSNLSGHPDMKTTPGVDMTTGSLGQGLSAANGMALAGKLDGADYQVYCILGDGEMQEGQIWEAALTAHHRHLDNVIAIVDYNRLQIDGPTSQIKDVEPLKDKWAAFGWAVREVDGHDIREIVGALEEARGREGEPTVIIAKTIKGKGISFMENRLEWHGKAPNREELRRALEELGVAGNG